VAAREETGDEEVRIGSGSANTVLEVLANQQSVLGQLPAGQEGVLGLRFAHTDRSDRDEQDDAQGAHARCACALHSPH
jgi:hypothetical protein